MNAPDRELAYEHNEDDIKVVIQDDPKVVNAAKVTIIKEDHTVGTLLRSELLKDPEIRFAGYRMPHPLENLLELKLQTSGNSEPIDALKDATDRRIRQIGAIENVFREKVTKYQQEHFLY